MGKYLQKYVRTNPHRYMLVIANVNRISSVCPNFNFWWIWITSLAKQDRHSYKSSTAHGITNWKVCKLQKQNLAKQKLVCFTALQIQKRPLDKSKSWVILTSNSQLKASSTYQFRRTQVCPEPKFFIASKQAKVIVETTIGPKVYQLLIGSQKVVE